MKLLKDLVILAAAAIAGYVLYKIWLSVRAGQQAVTSAADSISGAANAWTPAGIASSVVGDMGAAWNSIMGSFGTPNGATPAGLPAVVDNLTGNVVSGAATAFGTWAGTPSADNTVQFTGPSPNAPFYSAGMTQEQIDQMNSTMLAASLAGAAPMY